jgi:hypothetical protein
MQNEESKGLKQIYPGKFLFHLNSKDIYYLTLEIIDIKNIQILLIKLQPKETYVYKSIIPFQNFNTNDMSVYDTFKNLNYFINNFNFSLSEEINKIILVINNQTRIEVGQYNKNMEEKEKNEKNNTEIKNSVDKLKEKMNNLYNIISMQKNKIAELKQKEESQVKLINKIEEVTHKINEQYQQQIQNKNNNIQQQKYNNNQNNNGNYTNNDNKKNLFMSQKPNYGRYPSFNDSNQNNMSYRKNSKLNVTVNVELKPYLPDNANMDNLLTSPQYMNHPFPQNRASHMKTKSNNLDNIPDYRNNRNYNY